jgi:hypothetical protein
LSIFLRSGWSDEVSVTNSCSACSI